MSAYGEMILSRVVDGGNVTPLIKHRVSVEDFATKSEQAAYTFVMKYAEQNGGKTPSYAELAQQADITYIPQVSDSYEYLTRQLKAQSAKLQMLKLLQEEAPKKFSELDGNSFLEWLTEESVRIKMRTNVLVSTGVDLKKDTELFLEEYRKRKEGRSFRIWKSKFATINRDIGGYLSSNMYTWYARSGRGKSVVTMEEAIEAAYQGANVLVWALEMSKYEWLARAYSSISARKGLLCAEIDGQIFEAGFENRALLSGQLGEQFEAGLETFLQTLNDDIPGSIVVKAIDDENFGNYDCRQLESDILATKADVVVIDPFYYMAYERNTSKVAGGDAAATSKKLRQLAGKHGIVLHVITQADEVSDDKGDDGERELRPPSRAEIKKTKAVLEDAAAVFGIDTVAKDGLGVIHAGKGRAGGEDSTAQLLYMPSIGIVREMETGAEAAGQFESVF